MDNFYFAGKVPAIYFGNMTAVFVGLETRLETEKQGIKKGLTKLT